MTPEPSPGEVKRWMRELRESRGWILLLEYAAEQIQGRTDEVMLKPAGGLDNALAQEFSKGEVAGIRLFTMMPETVESIAAAQVKSIAQENASGPEQAN